MATSARQLRSNQAFDRRSAVRRPVAVTHASVGHLDGVNEAKLLDLSIYGCRLQVDQWKDGHERLWLRFNGGCPIAASVVWTDGGRIGCRFDEPIAGSLMRDLIRASPSSPATA